MNNIDLSFIYVIRVPMSWIIAKFGKFNLTFLNTLKEIFFAGDSRVDVSKVRIVCYDDRENNEGIRVDKLLRNKKTDLFEKKTSSNIARSQLYAQLNSEYRDNDVLNANSSDGLKSIVFVNKIDDVDKNDEMLNYISDAVLQFKDFLDQLIVDDNGKIELRKSLGLKLVRILSNMKKD